jgi:hypothetical protein
MRHMHLSPKIRVILPSSALYRHKVNGRDVGKEVLNDKHLDSDEQGIVMLMKRGRNIRGIWIPNQAVPKKRSFLISQSVFQYSRRSLLIVR